MPGTACNCILCSAEERVLVGSNPSKLAGWKLGGLDPTSGEGEGERARGGGGVGGLLPRLLLPVLLFAVLPCCGSFFECLLHPAFER